MDGQGRLRRRWHGVIRLDHNQHASDAGTERRAVHSAYGAAPQRTCLPHADASPGERCHERTTRTRCERHERVYQAYRAARRGDAYSSPEYRAERHRVLDGVTVCPGCGRAPTRRNPMTADHIVPRAQGGGARGNLRPLCRECNSRRGATVRSS